MDGVQSGEAAADSAYCQKREVKNIAYLVITGDRGLCGGYNISMCKEALAQINANAVSEKIIVVGSKGRDYFRRRGKNIVKEVHYASETVTYLDAEKIGKQLIDMYNDGEVDEVYIVYTHFVTVLTHEPRAIKVLPLSEPEGEKAQHSLMTYDPDVVSFMEYAVPMYLNTIVYGAMAESIVCEQAARMTSMDSAARNAEEIIDDLTLVYNRKRQGAITQEITEIVSGANAIQ
jgi:F-type H+-transporting ATPase subunit gamma